MDVACTTRTVGGTNPSREKAGAAALLLGAIACAATTLRGWPLYQTLLVLGLAVSLAWLVDGSSKRFLGPGLLASAVGGGITLYRALETDGVTGEHAIVYPLIGMALLAASLFNPLAIRGAGTFLLIVGVVATVDTPWNSGWTLVFVLAVWSVLEFVQVNRRERGAPEAMTEYAANGRPARSPVNASR